MILKAKFVQFVEREARQPDHGRAWRCTIAFMAPLLLALTGRLPVEITFAALAAQSIALIDVRGAYALRFTLLLSLTAILAGAAGFGALAAHPLGAAMAATLVVAALTGLWRHLSSDYGPSIAVSSSLVFFIALALPGGTVAAAHHALAALIGGLWGTLLQVALWPINPQHPLRRSVADTWLAVADLFGSMTSVDSAPVGAPRRETAECEAEMRLALDKTYSVLDAAAHSSPLRTRLEQLNLAGARLAMRVEAFKTELDALKDDPAFKDLEAAFQPALIALTNTGRSVAIAVVSRQPSHLATVEIRLHRLTNLLRALEARVTSQTAGSPAGAHLAEILRQIESHLPAISEALRTTIDRAGERAEFSLELFDLQSLPLRPLAAALNLNWRFEWVLVRYTLRIAVLTLVGVAFFKTHDLPHGYWLPFTMVVVLQPDYGATRKRAAQRLLGTLAGSILASAMLWLHLPFWPLMATTAAMSFCFGYFVKRNYAIAVIFVTLFVVLLTEANGPVTIALTEERLATTVAGGMLALAAALLFWPVWEKDRFPPILAQALRANRDYLVAIIRRLETGGAYDAEAIGFKRRAETADSSVFASLQRMAGDPKNRQDRIEQAAAMANGNQRLTRIANLLVLHLQPGAPPGAPELKRFSSNASEGMEALAAAVENPGDDRVMLGRILAALGEPGAGPGPAAAVSPQYSWVLGQLARAQTELSAMLLAGLEAEK